MSMRVGYGLSIGTLAVMCATLVPARAQEKAPEPSGAVTADSENPKQDDVLALAQETETLSASSFTYDPRGRRDPFESVWDKRRRAGDRPAGIRGMEISELDLQGIIMSGAGAYAVVMGTDNKGYNLREGDELYNGKVKTIEADRVVFLQKVNDPLSIKEYTEVVKKLNPEER